MTGQVSARDCYSYQFCEILPWSITREDDNPPQGLGEPAWAFFVAAHLGATVYTAVAGVIAVQKGVEVLQLL
jgi:hypothetical protein